MITKDMSISNVARMIACIGEEALLCNICHEKLLKHDTVNKAIMRDGHAQNPLYVCMDCFDTLSETMSDEDIFRMAVQLSGDLA